MRATARRLILALYNIDETYYLNENKKKLSDAELCVIYALDDGQLLLIFIQIKGLVNIV